MIKKLLKWISRVDEASRSNAPRPPFMDENGDPIFPEGPWWLTDVSRRAEEDQKNAQADVEDGPPSEMEEGQAAEVSDDDPLSEMETYEPPRHNPTVAWTS